MRVGNREFSKKEIVLKKSLNFFLQEPIEAKT